MLYFGETKGQRRTRHPNYFEKPRADTPALDRGHRSSVLLKANTTLTGEGDRDKVGARVLKRDEVTGRDKKPAWLTEFVVWDTSDRIGTMKLQFCGSKANKGGTVAERASCSIESELKDCSWQPGKVYTARGSVIKRRDSRPSEIGNRGKRERECLRDRRGQCTRCVGSRTGRDCVSVYEYSA